MLAQFAQVISVIAKTSQARTLGIICRCPRLTLTGGTLRIARHGGCRLPWSWDPSEGFLPRAPSQATVVNLAPHHLAATACLQSPYNNLPSVIPGLVWERSEGDRDRQPHPVPHGQTTRTCPDRTHAVPPRWCHSWVSAEIEVASAAPSARYASGEITLCRTSVPLGPGLKMI